MTALDNNLDTWQWQNLNHLPAKPPIQPTLGTLGDIGLVYPGKRHVFSGPQESAKTLCAYLIGISVGRQGGLWALIDFEMGSYDTRDRLTDLGATPDDLDALLYIEPGEAATPDRLERLILEEVDLVVIDAAAGAYDLQGLDDNKRQDVERLTSLYVRNFWQNGIATIMLDHVVKNTETRGAYAIGSERKVGGADVHLGFSVITPISRGHSGLYKITTHKDRGGYLKRGVLAEMELQSHPDTHAITCELRPAQEADAQHPWLPTKVMQKVSELLEKQTEPISRNHTATLAGGKRAIAITAIDTLVRLNYVTETNGPRGAKLLQHNRSFTVLDWENQAHDPPVPTYSPLVPGTSPSTCSPPPYKGGGREQVDAHRNGSPVPDEQTSWSWVDELEPPHHPEPPTNIPF